MYRILSSSSARFVSSLLTVVLVISGLSVLSPLPAQADELDPTPLILPEYVTIEVLSSDATTVTLLASSNISPTKEMPVAFYKRDEPVAISIATGNNHVDGTTFTVDRPTLASVYYYVTFGDKTSNYVPVYSKSNTERSLDNNSEPRILDNHSDLTEVQTENQVVHIEDTVWNPVLSLEKSVYGAGEHANLTWSLNQTLPNDESKAFTIVEKDTGSIIYQTVLHDSATIVAERDSQFYGYSRRELFEDRTYVGYVHPFSGTIPDGYWTGNGGHYFGVDAIAVSNEITVVRQPYEINLESTAYHYSTSDEYPTLSISVNQSYFNEGLTLYLVDKTSNKILSTNYDWANQVYTSQLPGYSRADDETTIWYSNEYVAYVGYRSDFIIAENVEDIGEIIAESSPVTITREPWDLSLSVKAGEDCENYGCNAANPFLELIPSFNQDDSKALAHEATYYLADDGRVLNNYYAFQYVNGPQGQLWLTGLNQVFVEPPKAIRLVKAYPKNRDPYHTPITVEDLVIVATSSFSSSGIMQKIREKWAGGSNPSDANCEQTCLGDPVNSFTGEFFEQEQDISIDGPLPFSFSRSFSTFNNEDEGPFGYGWTHNYAMRLAGSSSLLSESDTISLIQENSSVSEFYKVESNGSTEYLSPRDIRAELREENGYYLFSRYGDSLTYKFNSAGILVEITDRNQNSLTLSYSSGKLITVASNSGKTLTISWNSNRISSITDGIRTVSYFYTGGQLSSIESPSISGLKSYEYDSENRIIEIIHPNGGSYVNEYDSENRVSKQTNPLEGETYFAYNRNSSGYVTTVTLPDESVIKETYDSYGHLTNRRIEKGWYERVDYSYSYDAFGRKITEFNPLGNATYYTYDNRGNVLTIKDSLNRVVRFTYNEFDQVVQIIDAMGEITTNNYDSSGNLISSEDAKGQVTTYEFNSNGTAKNIMTAEDFLTQNGKKTEFSYDSNGYVNLATSPEGNSSQSINNSLGLPLNTEDPLGRITNYSYNTKNQLVGVELPSGSERFTLYDEAGRVKKITDELGRETTLTYDSMDNVLTETNVYGTRSYEYDSMQRLVKVTNPDQKIKEYSYDFLGRVIAIVDENGNETLRTYQDDSLVATVEDALGNITEYSYDSVGNILQIEHANEVISQRTYDNNNRLLTDTSANGYSESYSYDEVGNVISVVKAGLETTAYEYDANSRLVKTVYPDNSEELRSYDSDDNLLSVVSRDNETTEYSYNAGGELTKLTRADLSEENYSYTVAGQIDQISYDDWTTVDTDYSYDIAGRITSETKQGVITNYSYDAIGNMTRRGPPTGPGVEYSYNQYGELTGLEYPSGLELIYSYENNGKLKSVAQGTETLIEYDYNAIDLPTKVTYGNGVEREVSYDEFSQLSSITLRADNQDLYEKELTYQPAGLLIGSTVSVNSSTSEEKSYGYSALQRLESVLDELAQTTITYSHDSSSNLLSQPSGTSTFTANGKLLSGTSGNESITYTHDSRGNRIEKVQGTLTTAYEWSADNKLSSVTLPGSTSADVSYSYGANGLLASRTEGNQSDEFVWDTLNSAPTLLEDDENLYIYGIESNPSIQIDASTDEVTYLHGDERGSIVAATNDTGELLWTRSYDEYGATVTQTAQSVPATSFETNFAYAGEYKDPTTGLYNLRARWYEPETGSFLSKDPALLATGEAYSYASGDPLRYTDPLGLYSQNATWGAGILEGIGVPGAADLMNQLQPGSVDICSNLYQSIAYGVAGASIFIPGLNWLKGFSAVNKIKNAKNLISEYDRLQAIAKNYPGVAHGKTFTKSGGIALNKEMGDSFSLDIARNIRDAVMEKAVVPSLFPRMSLPAGKQRRFDIYDPINGIAHEAKVGSKLSEAMRQEISNDIALLNSGAISEMYWHFTRSPITGRTALENSPELGSLLSSKGIRYMQWGN